MVARARAVNGPTNMQVVAPSRRRTVTWDVFVLKVRDDTFFYGRVVAIDVIAGTGKSYLFSDEVDLEPEAPVLVPSWKE
jgi:hypothetical protein